MLRPNAWLLDERAIVAVCVWSFHRLYTHDRTVVAIDIPIVNPLRKNIISVIVRWASRYGTSYPS